MADVNNSRLFRDVEGIDQPADALVVLVKTEWNSEIADELERGCLRMLNQHNTAVKTLVVPGAVEIPFAIKQCSEALPGVTAFIGLGCVIRGDTPHFDYVCQSVTQGITHLNLSLKVPVIFGILTVNTLAQAHDRIGGAHGHKGEEAAITALKMMALLAQLKQGKFS